MSSITTTRERLNDLCSLSLVCRNFRGPAQAALFGDSVIRAGGRATLLLRSLRANKVLADSCGSLSWCSQTRRASGETLASLLNLARPAQLALGSGFFSRSHFEKPDGVVDALKGIGVGLRSFAFGGYDLETTSSDYITYLLSSEWSNLRSLSLRQVRFDSHHAIFLETQQDSFWRCYNRPAFKLSHIAISFVKPMGTSRTMSSEDGKSDESWLHWLLSSSVMTLTSLDLANLTEALPDDALQVLSQAAAHFRHLSITEYEGEDLLGDRLASGAASLVSLTLGGLASVGMPNNKSMDVLASRSILEGRQKLRYLELQNFQLFERLALEEAMRDGKLPHLQQIVLTNASRVHPRVQLLDAYCTKASINFLVRR